MYLGLELSFSRFTIDLSEGLTEQYGLKLTQLTSASCEKKLTLRKLTHAELLRSRLFQTSFNAQRFHNDNNCKY